MTLVSEQIAGVLVTRLEQIAIANGYTFDVVSVDRPNSKANEWRPRHLSIVVVQDTTEMNEEVSCPGNPPACGYDTSYSIHGFVLPSDRSTETYLPQVNAMELAIKEAVTQNDVNWVHFGSLALIAEFGVSEPFLAAEGDNQGVTVPLKVTYRVNELNQGEVR